MPISSDRKGLDFNLKQMTTNTTDSKRGLLRQAMLDWAHDEYEHIDMLVEIESAYDVPAWLMARVDARRRWYIAPDDSFDSVDAYIAATYAAFQADVPVCRAEADAEEATRRKRRRLELAAEAAANPPQRRASMRARK